MLVIHFGMLVLVRLVMVLVTTMVDSPTVPGRIWSQIPLASHLVRTVEVL